jgi:hypothetical protein
MPRPVIVHTAKSTTAGMLYFRTARHVVLLNHVVSAVDLGPVRTRRNDHLSHEADITIIPASDVIEIEYLEMKK